MENVNFGEKIEELTIVRAPPNSLGNRYASSRRLKPFVETLKDKTKLKKTMAKKNSLNNLTFTKLNSKVSTCSFCGETTHRVTNCAVKLSFGKDHDAHAISEYLLKRAPYKYLPANKVDEIIYSDIGSSRNGTRHIVIHTLYLKCQKSGPERPFKEDFITHISLLDRYAKPMCGYNKCFVDLPMVIQYIFKHNTTKGRYIFSEVKEKSVGDDFYNSQTEPVNHYNLGNRNQHMSHPMLYSASPSLPAMVPETGTYKNPVDICNGNHRFDQHFSCPDPVRNSRHPTNIPVTGLKSSRENHLYPINLDHPDPVTGSMYGTEIGNRYYPSLSSQIAFGDNLEPGSLEDSSNKRDQTMMQYNLTPYSSCKKIKVKSTEPNNEEHTITLHI
jgi:hypothetical protein